MNYYIFNVKEKEYKLKLTTRNVIALEKALGCNPLMIFGAGDRIPTITEMIEVLHASLQRYEHGVTLDDAYDIFDEWLDDGHSMIDFVNVMVEIYRVSGLINNTEKN